MNIYRRSLLPLLALCVVVAVANIGYADSDTTDPSPKHTPFVTALFCNWDRWDTNKDGELSDDEIDHAVQDSDVKGDDAAVAGVLKLMSRQTQPWATALTRNNIMEYDRATLARAAGSETVPENRHATGLKNLFSGQNESVDWDRHFTIAQSRLNKIGGTWPTQFTLKGVSQGPLGDCFLIATIGSMVEHNPDELKRIISPNTDGTYQVTLPGSKSFVLQPPTQSQLVISSSSGGRGEWVAVFEQAIGKYNENRKLFTDGEATDSISNGGQTGQTMSLLTGHKCSCVHMWTTVSERKAREEKQLALLQKELVSAIHDTRAITADVVELNLGSTLSALMSKARPKIPPDIYTRHAYAVLAFNVSTDTVTFWNPHGEEFQPAGPDGLENGYTTHHGQFKVPLEQAYAFFDDFLFETATPLPPAAGLFR